MRTPIKGVSVKRVTASNPPKRSGKNPNAAGFTRRVFTLYGYRCLVCDKAKAVQAHHCVPRQRITKAPHLSQTQRDALEYDARNGLPICMSCHAAHEYPGVRKDARIPRAKLRPEHFEWAVQFGFATTINDRKLYP